MKLVYWPQPAQAPLRCTWCNRSPINGQCTNHRIGPLLCGFNVPMNDFCWCATCSRQNQWRTTAWFYECVYGSFASKATTCLLCFFLPLSLSLPLGSPAAVCIVASEAVLRWMTSTQTTPTPCNKTQQHQLRKLSVMFVHNGRRARRKIRRLIIPPLPATLLLVSETLYLILVLFFRACETVCDRLTCT